MRGTKGRSYRQKISSSTIIATSSHHHHTMFTNQNNPRRGFSKRQTGISFLRPRPKSLFILRCIFVHSTFEILCVIVRSLVTTFDGARLISSNRFIRHPIRRAERANMTLSSYIGNMGQHKLIIFFPFQVDFRTIFCLAGVDSNIETNAFRKLIVFFVYSIHPE